MTTPKYKIEAIQRDFSSDNLDVFYLLEKRVERTNWIGWTSSRWIELGRFDTREQAEAAIQNERKSPPETTYYDEHGDQMYNHTGRGLV